MRQVHDKLGLVLGLSLGALACGAAACHGQEGTGTASATSAPAATARPAARETKGVATTGVRLERAIRTLDRGGDAAEAKAELEGVLADTRATTEEQDDARLGLSRAREALGDKEGAIGAVEELLSSHAQDGRFAAREPAEKRLRFLLTGSESEGPSFSTTEKYAPVARALTTYFQPDEHGEILVDVLAFGRNGEHLEDLGGFAIAAAKRDSLRQTWKASDDVKVFQSISRTGSWVDLPRMFGETDRTMPQLDRSLLVFFFDLDADRVPSRYDEYLPMPSADIVARLEKGDGLIAMRERKGAKPTIVIAAPRVGQLVAVEEAFAKLSTLPKEPLSVTLDAHLTADEIQNVVRGSFSDAKHCYESLLERDPKAAGTVVMKFEVTPEGAAKSASEDDWKSATKTTLTDPTLLECLADVVSKLKFPASGRTSTVAYPIAFSP